jgi:hypothetical protein
MGLCHIRGVKCGPRILSDYASLRLRNNLRGRVCKQVTNAIKTDVMGFLRVAPGRSTVQLHDRLGSRGYFQ